MRAICDGPCRVYTLINKVIRYDNSPNVRYICGPCNEKYQNRQREIKAKISNYRPQQRRAA